MRLPFNDASPRLKDLLSLVANSATDPHKILEKGFEWQHLRALEVAKWSLAAASGLVAALVVASVKDNSRSASETTNPISGHTWHALLDQVTNWSVVIALGAGFLLMLGIVALRAASRTQHDYVVAQGLLARLITIAPFLRRASEQIDLNP